MGRTKRLYPLGKYRLRTPKNPDKNKVEKAREFAPFGHAGFDPTGIIRLTP